MPQNAASRYLSLSPEADLLLGSLSGPWHADMRERVGRLADNGVDWDKALRLAQTWRIEPILYETLKLLKHPSVPPACMETLETAYRANAKRNITLVSECLRILDLMKKRGIRCAPYKGPFLASTLYRNLSLRLMVDLDFLVPRDSLLEAVGMLRAHGFELYPARSDAKLKRILASKFQYVISVIKPSEKILIELHWGVNRQSSLTNCHSDFFWNLLQPARRLGMDVSIFPDDEMFFLLCLHDEKHSWRDPRYLIDLMLMIEAKPGLDWEKIHRLCDRFHQHAAIDVSLRAVQDILGRPIPAEAWTGKTAEKRLAQRVALIRARLFRNGLAMPGYREWKDCMARSSSTNPNANAGGFLAYMRNLLFYDYDPGAINTSWLRIWPFHYSMLKALRIARYEIISHFNRNSEDA